EHRAVSARAHPEAVAHEPAPPAGALLAPERSLLTGRSAPLVIGSAGDRLERGAERGAAALVERRAPQPRTAHARVCPRDAGAPPPSGSCSAGRAPTRPASGPSPAAAAASGRASSPVGSTSSTPTTSSSATASTTRRAT